MGVCCIMPGNFRTELSFLSFRSGWLCDKIDDDDDDDLPLPSRALRRCTSISTLGSALVLAPKVFSSIVLPPRASAARGTAVVCTRGGDNLIDLNARGPQRFLIYGCRLKLTQAPFGSSPLATGAVTWRGLPPPVRSTRNYVEIHELVRAFGVARQTEQVHPKFCVSIRPLHYTPHAVQAGGVHVCWVQASS